MAQPGRLGMTEVQKGELWHRWRKGESITDISRALGTYRTSVSYVLRRHGGFAPLPRKRSPDALTLAEREEISRGLSAEHSLRQIAKALQRSPSTISREIARNGGRQRYRAIEADKAAWARSRRPKLCRLAQHGKLRRTVANKLALDWSPEQISAWLKCTYPDDETLRVSHETVYKRMSQLVIAIRYRRATSLCAKVAALCWKPNMPDRPPSTGNSSRQHRPAVCLLRTLVARLLSWT